MNVDKKKQLACHAPWENKEAIREIQRFFAGRGFVPKKVDINPSEMFYYAKQDDIRKPFGKRVREQSWPDEFDGVKSSRDMFWGHIKGVGQVVFAGDDLLIIKQEGFTVAKAPERTSSTARSEQAVVNAQCAVVCLQNERALSHILYCVDKRFSKALDFAPYRTLT